MEKNKGGVTYTCSTPGCEVQLSKTGSNRPTFCPACTEARKLGGIRVTNRAKCKIPGCSNIRRKGDKYCSYCKIDLREGRDPQKRQTCSKPSCENPKMGRRSSLCHDHWLEGLRTRYVKKKEKEQGRSRTWDE